MKTRTIISILISLFAFSACQRSKFDSEYETLKHDGEKRSYLLHVPEGYSSDSAVALIIALHGGTGSAKNIEEQSGLADFSDEKGFILCSPNGLNRTWNAGNCCGKASENEVDDVGFISALIDEVSANYSINSKQIFFTGMSNGAMMSYRLACELSDKIAAIAPVAGTMVATECNPSQAVSVVHFHSYEDENVPYDGGIGNGISDHYNPPLDSVFNAWNGFNNCALSTYFSYNDNVDFWSWLNCTDSTELQLYITKDGGHSWPMGIAPRKNADQPSVAINANEVMWHFFMSHPKP
ncbi:MAG: hypothetical protein NWQ55_12000 [Salibacteraceae bacterium]|jgi:polyhydroxybutyrate depolymerase|nr:hypothetical protein [Salibacteraceae bacterium]MDP4685301.1 hypothetical protein [Salibacteraceae bacterium]MDP4763874.1 hypothetical protein [Salibacteraceae bacterium]MDP4935498.1 hypothetical protein [Salibacteraceae bacterium]MDP4965792.1 hypothetical protein [Salibacteraceae bacterium]